MIAVFKPAPMPISIDRYVSDTTLDSDRGSKRCLYATSGIREYRVVDVNDGRGVVYSDPDGGDCRAMVEYRQDDSLAPQAPPNVKIAVKELFASSGGVSAQP